MLPPVVGEKNYPLRISPVVYEQVKRLATERERSANWVMARLLAKAISESPEWIAEALG